DLAGILKDKNMAFIYVSANSDHETLMKAKATQPYGFIVKPFRERDLIVTLEIAQYRHEHSLEADLRKEELFEMALQDIVKMEGNKNDKMFQISKTIQAYLPFDYFAIYSNIGNKRGDLISNLRIGFDEYQYIGLEEFQIITKLNQNDINKLQYPEANIEKSFFNGEDFKEMLTKFDLRKLIAKKFMTNSLLMIPLETSDDIYLNSYF